MYRSRTTGWLWVLAFCMLGAQSPAAAQSKAPETVRVRVDSVLAADTNEGMDKRLASTVGSRLTALFGFTTYRLVKRQDEKTPCGRMVSFNLPGGHILQIAPRSVEGGMIAMKLVLFYGGRPVMATDLKLMNHGVLIIGGSRYEQGMLITTIAAETLSHDNGKSTETARAPSPQEPAPALPASSSPPPD
jgi:hypothetical protein